MFYSQLREVPALAALALYPTDHVLSMRLTVLDQGL